MRESVLLDVVKKGDKEEAGRLINDLKSEGKKFNQTDLVSVE